MIVLVKDPEELKTVLNTIDDNKIFVIRFEKDDNDESTE